MLSATAALDTPMVLRVTVQLVWTIMVSAEA
jgi:hypothetical protein